MALRLGQRHVELAGKWFPTAMSYAVAGSLTMLYFTDWKAVLEYVPFYGGKFQNQE